jgi:N-acetylneuraminic acid mutarotase
MKQQILNKKIIIGIVFLALFALFYFFFFKSTEAQVCTGYLVWPGTWEPGRIPMASNQQYVLTGSPLYVSGSNVGIGTTNPVYTFQVNGDISGTRLCIGSDCRSVWPGGGIAGSGLAGQVTFWTSSTDLGGDNNLFWDNLNKRLGIGTTTPQTSLHVIGNITANNIIATSFLGTINASNISSGQFGANTGGGNYSFMGNVGIGTTAPGQKLDVVGGYIRSDTGFCIGTSCITSWQTGGGYWAASGANIYNTNTGNVGIGTPTPAEKLHVIGNAIISGTLTAGSISGTFTGTINAGNISSGQFGANTGGGNYSFPGNVGIGTTPQFEDSLVIKTATLPTRRAYLACAENSATHKIYCFGGYGIISQGIVGFLDQIVEYDPATDTLTIKTATLPTGREGLACAENSATHKIYCFGGNDGTFLNQIVEYDPATDTLTIKTATLPTGREGLACAENSFTHRIYCFGGYDSTYGGSYVNEIVEYDPETDTLIRKAYLPGRAYLACAENSATHKIYCFGGYGIISQGIVGLLDQIVEYDPGANTGRIKTATLPNVRAYLACAENSATHKIYCFGGSGGTYINQIVEYDPATDTLTIKTATLPTGRWALACAENSATHKIYCFGGHDGIYLNQIVEYPSVYFYFVYKLDIGGALRLQPSSAPIGANGVIYYDSTANKFKCFENGAWKDCISAGGIPSGAYIAFPDSNPRPGFTYTGVIEVVSTGTTQLNLYWFQKQ